MADEDRTFDPNAVQANRAERQGQDLGRPDRTAASPPGAALNDRNAAGIEAVGDLGASTPAGVDIHDLGQADNPQEEWGEAAGADAMFSSNHARRPVRTEAERGQGAKTRQLNKDIVSRRT